MEAGLNIDTWEAIKANKELLDRVDKEQNHTMYSSWDKAARETRSVGPNYDYSRLREGDKGDGIIHSGDEGKLPNHVTYSGQSDYAKAGLGRPGRWDMRGVNGSKEDVFYPDVERLSDPGYVHELGRYAAYEHGKGMDRIQTPNGYDRSKLDEIIAHYKNKMAQGN